MLSSALTRQVLLPKHYSTMGRACSGSVQNHHRAQASGRCLGKGASGDDGVPMRKDANCFGVDANDVLCSREANYGVAIEETSG